MLKSFKSLSLTSILKMQSFFLIFLFMFSAINHYLDGFYEGIFLPLAILVFLLIFLLYIYLITTESYIYLNFFVLILVVIIYVLLQKPIGNGTDLWRLSASGLIPIMGFWIFSPWLTVVLGVTTFIGLEIIYFSHRHIYFHILIWFYFLLLYLLTFGIFYFNRLKLKLIAVEAKKNNLEGIYTTEFFKKHLISEFARIKVMRKNAYFISLDFVQDSVKINRRELVFYINSVKNHLNSGEFIFKLKRTKLVIAVLGMQKLQIIERIAQLERQSQKYLKKEVNIVFNLVELDYKSQNLDDFLNNIYANS